jgi:hypothetical protein
MALLAAPADVAAVLTPAEIDESFDLEHELRHVDRLFERVFRPAEVPA